MRQYLIKNIHIYLHNHLKIDRSFLILIFQESIGRAQLILWSKFPKDRLFQSSTTSLCNKPYGRNLRPWHEMTALNTLNTLNE